ncbi:undecaprenyldiphospho-muramoylpentapeptide beta-N-acetylglucosaminyltransferase [Pontivivens nitratireducens]|uniref:undecaprenyldiphospho-muramoylpentapeptide beta-N-acetylglucosaminyltransferase n=1 Tax=Pontivivens nitratireducens TaxID=2758038 RepID=UPI0016398B4C|nr:undecaprenyldiphospho-muramoylpentapeptide beta-N-acetylglucosaminyltransferase [Pontibrevibacter nitratireducens]
MKPRKLVIAAGGTGGHMFPAQALAEEMLRRGWQVSLSTDARGARYAGAFPDAVTREVVRAATPARGGLRGKLTAPLLIARGVWDTWRAMRRDRPAVVAGFGGYPAVPAMSAAKMLGIPTLIHEQNGVPGRVNRLFAPRVDIVACSVEPTVLPSGATAEHTGNPVRGSVFAMAGADYDLARSDTRNVLVIGGSQGAAILSRVVPAALAALPDELRARLKVAHQARGEDETRVREAYAAASIEADVRSFFDDVPQRLADCHLVISRAGASSVADIAVVGRPSILIPYALATDDHQAANARGLVQAGAALMIREDALDSGGLSTEIAAILGDPTRAASMAEAARNASRPDAVQRLADLVERMSKGTAT